MAIPPEPNPNQNDNTSFSYFLKTVVLRDWWLIKSQNDVEGKSLCISGYASTKKEAQRLFNSAPITKRHDVFTLETADGIYIILQGLINKDRTLESGFSSEVFDRFVFGFPLDWDECVEKFFENAGAKDSSSISSLSKDDAISENDGNVDVRRECSPVIFEKFDDGASEGNHEDHAATISNSCQEEMIGPNDNIDVTEERTIFPNQGNRSIPISPTDKSADTVKNSALGNIASTLGHHITSVDSSEVSKIVLAITSSHLVETEQRKKSSVIRKAEGSPCAEGMERSKNESVEYAELDSSNEDNHNLSNYNQNISLGTSGMTLTVSSNKHKISNRKRKEHETDKDVFGDIVTNISDVPSIQGNNKAVADYYDQNKEITEAAVAETSAPGDSSAVTPPCVGRNTFNPVSRKLKSRKGSRLLSKMKNEGKRKHVSGCSVKTGGHQKKLPMTPSTAPQIIRKRKEHETDKDVFGDVVTNVSDVPTFQGNNKTAADYYDQNKETPEATVAETSAPGDSNSVTPPSVGRNTLNPVSRKSKSRNSSRLLSKMKNEGKSKHVSYSTKTRGKEKKPPMTPITAPQINIPEAMNRVTSRLRSVVRNLNTEDNKEQKATSKRGSSKKAKRKISFDAHIEVKTSIQSPESLSLKRSRSGRLLLPALDFWRNQIPVFDADRNITGIQEEIVAAKPSKGSKSEPQKTWKSRR